MDRRPTQLANFVCGEIVLVETTFRDYCVVRVDGILDGVCLIANRILHLNCRTKPVKHYLLALNATISMTFSVSILYSSSSFGLVSVN